MIGSKSVLRVYLLRNYRVALTDRHGVPGRLARVLEIQLPRPRTVEMEFDKRFKDYSDEVRSLIFARRQEGAHARRA